MFMMSAILLRLLLGKKHFGKGSVISPSIVQSVEFWYDPWVQPSIMRSRSTPNLLYSIDYWLGREVLTTFLVQNGIALIFKTLSVRDI